MIRKAIRISSYDVFPSGELKPSALQRYMQQLAREDCDQVGCTYASMREQNAVFVLTKLGLDMFEPVYSNEVITVNTMNNRTEGVSFYREFFFYRNDELIGRCTTQWVIVRYDTRAIVRPRELTYPIVNYNFDCVSVDIPRRLGDASRAEFLCDREVVLSDLDENNHLNNCVYSDIVFDSIPLAGIPSVSGMRMVFQHEARRGDILHISYHKTDRGCVVFANNSTTGQPCFEAECMYTEK